MTTFKKEIEPEKSLKTPEVKQIEMLQEKEKGPNKVYNQEFIDILETNGPCPQGQSNRYIQVFLAFN
jgi:hypothetical protein